jgi:hypothetical protein
MSSTPGRPAARLTRTAVESMPTSARVMPRITASTPERVRVDVAFGDEYSMAPVGTDDDHPVAHTGGGRHPTSSGGNGKAPDSDHRTEPLEHPLVGLLQLAGPVTEGRDELAGEHGDGAAEPGAPGWRPP